MTVPALSTRDLHKTFPGGTLALQGLDFTVERGRVYGLIGPNGAGKTTALRILLGVLLPDRGEALVLGRVFRKAPPSHRARVAYIPQDVSLPPDLALEEVFSFLAALYPRWDAPLAERLAGRLGLPMDRPVGTLSGGFRRRVALAAAFSTGAEVLVLDEPAAGLDPVGRRIFRDLVVDLASTGERTILISTHLLEDLERTADRVGIMKEGRMLLEEDMETLHSAYRKVQAIFPGNAPPPGFRPPGCLRFSVSGPVVQAVVRSAPGKEPEGWTPVPGVRLQEFPVTLEEVVLLALGGEPEEEEKKEALLWTRP
ncbi:MAG TPA: ABC transporter ATP-binding protein [Planctomycetes bacterium]|nr:ABC transporter ATP-binding protein [Planctomycetota bacterium]